MDLEISFEFFFSSEDIRLILYHSSEEMGLLNGDQIVVNDMAREEEEECWNYGSLLEWWLYYWNGGYTIENVAHYWNGGYTIGMMVILLK